jgi:hypothetical protein
MIKYPIESYDEDRTTLENLKILKQNAPSYPKCSLSLTCKSNGSICQKCYGWDLAQEKLISLEKLLRTIAIHWRTRNPAYNENFFIQEVFSSELLKQITAPFQEK